jgi:hypothetical protein
MDAGLTWRKIMSNRTCAVTLIALAMVTVEGAPASALRISEKTIKSECLDAGGTYGTKVLGGNRFSSCTYTDYYGDVYTDYYENGEYHSTRP